MATANSLTAGLSEREASHIAFFRLAFGRRCRSRTFRIARTPGRPNRQQILTNALDLENSVRGSLKVFGLRICTVTRRTFEARVLELVAEDRSLMATTEPMLRVRRALSEEFERLDRLCRQLARRDTVCRRLMTIPGVGTVVALTYRTGIDAPSVSQDREMWERISV
jgi:transposase